MYEGAPNFPDNGRFWRMIERHRVTILYRAPTAKSARFIRWGDEWPNKSNLSSLPPSRDRRRAHQPRGLDLVPEGGRGRTLSHRRHLGQTETGSIMMTTLPGALLRSPGSTGLPFSASWPDVVTKRGQIGGARPKGRSSRLDEALALDAAHHLGRRRTPSKAILEATFRAYFTGDGGRRDETVTSGVGRIDDVLNVAGHRIGTG